MKMKQLPKCILLFFLSLGSASSVAQFNVSGTITDDQGEGLPGATVMESGTQNGVITDINGNYQLTVENSNSIIEVSYLGFLTQRIVVGDRTTINITLEIDAETLDEVIVVGYGTQRKSDITGAVSSISNKDFNKGIVLDPGQALQGKQAGVIVVQSNGADPNSAPKVRIRGSNSINLSSDPLYVVDGFPLPEGVGLDINPEDIERMDILKDASATAIYGVRGANGVVLITTKEGEKQSSTFKYTNQIGFQRIIKPFEYASARQLASVENDLAIEQGQIPPYTEVQLDSIGDGTDWIDVAFRDAVYQNHNISLSSGSKNSSSYISLGYTDRAGVLDNTDFQRVNATVTLSNKSVKNLKLFTSIKGSHIDANFHNFQSGTSGRNSILSLILFSNPLIPAYNPDGSYGTVPRELGAVRNPLPDLLDVIKEDRRNTIYSNFSAEYNFLHTLKYKLNLGFSYEARRNSEFIPFNVQGGEPDAQGFGGVATVANRERINFLVEHLLEYTWKRSDIDKLTLLAGFTTQENDVIRYESSASGFATEVTTFYDLGAGNNIGIPVSSKTSWQLMSFLGRINYALKDKYLLTTSLRRDGASSFAEGNRWGIFPSAAVGWRLTEEPFMSFIPDHTELKLRVGWGQTGNFRGINEGDSQAKLGTNWSTYTYDGINEVVGLAPLNIPNPDLQWERTEQINLGMDISVFDNKWTFVIDYYDKLTDNLIYNRPVSVYTGFDEQTVTDGAVRNYGVELGAIGNVNLAKDLSLKINANISYNQNRIERLVDDTDSLLANVAGFGGSQFPYNLLIVGQPISTFYGYRADRILQTDDPEIQADGLQPNSVPGDYLFKDLDGNGIIDENDRTVLGSGLPVYVFGVNLTFKYRSLSLDAQFTGAYDVKRLNMNRARSENRFWKPAEDRWTEINTDTDIARANAWGNTQHGSFINDIFIEDASYVRLQNLTLAYDFSRLVKKTFLKSLKVSGTAQNVFTITNYKGFDPELSTGTNNTSLGLDFNAHPQSGNYIGSLKFTF